MKAAIKLMVFSILLNLSVGLMQTAIPAFETNPAYRGGMSYDAAGARDFASELNSSVNPTGDLEDSSNAFDRLLDKLNLGIIQKILRTIDKYMFGFVNVIQPVLNLDNGVMYFIKTLITISYALGAIWLWTGKDIGKG